MTPEERAVLCAARGWAKAVKKAADGQDDTLAVLHRAETLLLRRINEQEADALAFAKSGKKKRRPAVKLRLLQGGRA